jgi:FkbM family methyltransferase
VNKPTDGVTATFKKVGPNLLVVEDPQFGSFYFYERTRLKLYWPHGVDNRLKHMARKYQTDSVKVMPGDVVVDVGANIGEFTAAIHETARKCFAIEPDPVAYKCLEANALKLGNAKPLNIALSDKSGEMTFYLASKTADSSLVEPMVPHKKSIVNARRLDDVFPSFGVEAIDFLKVEAEGWEPEVLKGGETVLSTKVRKIAVDGGPERRGKPTSAAVIEILKDCGFTVSARGDIVMGIKSGRLSDLPMRH